MFSLFTLLSNVHFKEMAVFMVANDIAKRSCGRLCRWGLETNKVDKVRFEHCKEFRVVTFRGFNSNELECKNWTDKRSKTTRKNAII